MIDFLLGYLVEFVIIGIAIGKSYIKCPPGVPSWFVWRPPRQHVRFYALFVGLYLMFMGAVVGYGSAFSIFMMVLYIDAWIYILESRTWFKTEDENAD